MKNLLLLVLMGGVSAFAAETKQTEKWGLGPDAVGKKTGEGSINCDVQATVNWVGSVTRGEVQLPFPGLKWSMTPQMNRPAQENPFLEPYFSFQSDRSEKSCAFFFQDRYLASFVLLEAVDGRTVLEGLKKKYKPGQVPLSKEPQSMPGGQQPTYFFELGDTKVIAIGNKNLSTPSTVMLIYYSEKERARADGALTGKRAEQEKAEREKVKSATTKAVEGL